MTLLTFTTYQLINYPLLLIIVLLLFLVLRDRNNQYNLEFPIHVLEKILRDDIHSEHKSIKAYIKEQITAEEREIHRKNLTQRISQTKKAIQILKYHEKKTKVE